MEQIKTYLLNIATGSGAMLTIEAISLADMEIIIKIMCQIAIAAATIHTMLINRKREK